jgi:hypothetical protein
MTSRVAVVGKNLGDHLFLLADSFTRTVWMRTRPSLDCNYVDWLNTEGKRMITVGGSLAKMKTNEQGDDAPE